jgi:hypothetical protein
MLPKRTIRPVQRITGGCENLISSQIASVLHCLIPGLLGLGHAGPAQSLTLTVPTLEQSTPEVIPDEEMKAAQEKLRAEGIERNTQPVEAPEVAEVEDSISASYPKGWISRRPTSIT